MSYNGYIAVLKNVRPHPNADRLKLGEVFGNTVCVNLDYYEGQVGVYFPTDGQLDEEFCEANNLVRKKDENGNNIGGYMDPNKRNVTAIKLRNEKSDGLFLPLSCLEYTGIDVNTFNVGDVINEVNGHHICHKYIPRTNHKSHYSGGNKTRKKKENIAPLFVEHADTEQLNYNLDAFHSGDEIEITLKMHGTSQRTAHLPMLQGYADTWPCRVGNAFRHIMRKMGCYHGEDVHDGKPIYEWDYVSGTRRTVLDSYDGGYYGDNAFREQHHNTFIDKLQKGETVYYEVVGFTKTGVPIMADCANKKLNDKDFIKQYGETTRFSYDCTPEGEVEHFTDGVGTPIYGRIKPGTQSDIYVYRMTMTNDEGFVVEYTPDFMRYRCEQMGVKCVPVFWKGTIPENPASADDPTITPGEWIKNVAERFYDGPDPIGKTHVREGVVVRILNRPKFTAYKTKNFAFKCLEGLVKAEATAPDMEEADGLDMEENNEV